MSSSISSISKIFLDNSYCTDYMVPNIIYFELTLNIATPTA